MTGKGSVIGAGNRVGGDENKTSKRGRPVSPVPRAIRNAEAARRYRARKKEARRDPRQPLRSTLIDLSAIPAWRRGEAEA